MTVALPNKLVILQALGMTANTGEPTQTAPDPPRRGRVPADTLSNRLVLARKLEGLSIEDAVEQVYERTGVQLSKSSWANWEQGMRPQKETDVLQAIAWGLDVDDVWLIWGGPLESAKGRPVRPVADRPTRATREYPDLTIRPMPDRPMSRGPKSRTDRRTPKTGRPVIIERLAAAEDNALPDAA